MSETKLFKAQVKTNPCWCLKSQIQHSQTSDFLWFLWLLCQDAEVEWVLPNTLIYSADIPNARFPLWLVGKDKLLIGLLLKKGI